MPLVTQTVKTPDNFEEWLATEEGMRAKIIHSPTDALKLAWNGALELAAEVAEANEGVDHGIRNYKEKL